MSLVQIVPNVSPVTQIAPKQTLSEKYRFISSQEIIERFQAQGFVVSKVQSAKPRKVSNIGFQKHIVRFRRADIELKNVGDSYPEIVLVNSHDGSGSLKLILGVFRLVCTNGLIVGKEFESRRVLHVGDVGANLAIAIAQLFSQFDLLDKKVNDFASRTLQEQTRLELAYNAARLVVPEGATVDIASVIRPTRQADVGSDAWRTLNVLQESLIRGGIRYTVTSVNSETGQLETRKGSTRAVNSVTRSVELNQAVWDMVAQAA